MNDETKNYKPEGKYGIFPEVKYNKNGFEIRSDVLSMAVDYAKWQFEYKLKAHPELTPPSIADVIDIATNWNKFVCGQTVNTEKREK